jgi:hypothetical protein
VRTWTWPRCGRRWSSFTASAPAVGGLRPLRDPDAPELDEDETGAE